MQCDSSLRVTRQIELAIHRAKLGFPAGLFRPGKSRDGPRTGQDRTGPRDLEGPVVPWSRDQRSPKVPGLFS